MKLGIDLTSMEKKFGGGKDQVVFNLLKGWNEIGCDEELTLYLYEYSKEKIKSLVPKAKIVEVKDPLPRIRKKPLKDLFFRTCKLPKMIKKDNIDLLLFPRPYTSLRKLKIPTVVIPHDIQAIEYPEKFSWKVRTFIGFFYRLDFQLRDWIVAISEYDKHAIEKKISRHRKKIKQIHNPIVFPDITKNGHDISDKKPIILAVNIGYAHKNTETLIRAFERVCQKIPHELYLVGRVRAETNHLKDLVEKSEASHRIHLTGHIQEQELDDLYKKCQLFVSPSLYEGFGMTPVEAMGRGVPVIISKTTALMETTLGRGIYYSPAEDDHCLAETIHKTLKNYPDQETLEENQRLVHEAYDYKRIAEKYRSWLRSIS